MVKSLQHLLLGVVSTKDIIQRNLTHLLGCHNRFVGDLMNNRVLPVPQWLLCLLFNTEDTAFFWFYQFIHSKIQYIPINQIMFVGFQERYKRGYSMNMFAMRVSKEKVMVFVYTNPYIEKNGIEYMRSVPAGIMEQKASVEWTENDWDYTRSLTLETMFMISSLQKEKPYTTIHGKKFRGHRNLIS